MTQNNKALQFKELHHSGKLLMLPNIWDALGARLIESIGYPAIATASASVALTNGFDDGEKIPFSYVLKNLSQITSSVSLPVTADIECAYANNDNELEQNIKLLLQTGIVGINIEDTDKISGKINSISSQCNRIKKIRNIANEMNVDLFINARTDVLIHSNLFSTPEIQQQELINRGNAYKDAGADCFFPIALKNEESIKDLVKSIQMPVNILTIPGIPSLEILEKIGVARVSLGPSFLKIAIQAMKNLATDLQSKNGLSTIIENEVTTDYLKSLINTIKK
jgi:2-methylisocitrate lyase-like PEP mutase family enzyme